MEVCKSLPTLLGNRVMGDVELTLQQSAGLLRVAAACEKGRIVSESCHGYFGRLGQVAGKNIIEDWAKHRTLGTPRQV
ncbi:hypothetical protein EVAR_5051_1 [Eumeta japonica]|uniref:Uncharacterized protein n=1 Tax=Eumeta variegata TaxID=151549 RepID=A0A4C1SU89_EUMVA|nr:hypothetical protein EVAR_5051_1 [Eumeta japonica]